MSLFSLPEALKDRLNIAGLDMLGSFRFAVHIDGDLSGSGFLAGFNSVSGLGEQVEVREIKEGGYNSVHRFPRKRIINSITLTRGMTTSRFLWNWYNEVTKCGRRGPDYRKTVSIVMLDTAIVNGSDIPYEVWTWDLYDAWPSSWTGPNLNAMSSDLAFESVVLQHSGLSEAKGLFSNRIAEVSSLVI